eukprot:6213417-Pleurochrysis_carterae.AAC.2
MGGAVLFIGSANLIGQVLLERLLTTFSEDGDENAPTSVYVLVQKGRRVNKAEHASALKQSKTVENLPLKTRQSMHFVSGDIAQPNLGLTETVQALLTTSVTYIINAAGALEFELPIAETSTEDTTGSVRVVEFANMCSNLKAVVHCASACLTHAGELLCAAEIPALRLNVKEAYEQLKNSDSTVEQAISWLAATRLPLKCSYHRLLHTVQMPSSPARSRRRKSAPMLLTLVLATLTRRSLKAASLQDLKLLLTPTPLIRAY